MGASYTYNAAIAALAPDACLTDTCAPCRYWHLKLQALNGGRDKISQRDLEWVGVGIAPAGGRGWKIPSALELGEIDRELLAWLSS